MRTGLDDLLDDGPDGTAAAITLPAKTKSLPASRFKQFATLARDFTAYRDLVPASAVGAAGPATLSRSVSASWIGTTRATAWTSAVTNTVGAAAVAGKVSLSASPRVLMSSRTNEFPVTVINRLPEPITVRVVFTSDNPQRISMADTAPITVDAGQSQTINVRPEASSNGLVNVTAGLRTTSGQSVGQISRIAVEVTELGMIGWIIVVVSGAVLVATTVLRIRQVRRNQRKEEL